MISSKKKWILVFLYPGRPGGTSVVPNTGVALLFFSSTQGFNCLLFRAPVGLKAPVVEEECRPSCSLVLWGLHASHLVLKLAPKWQGFNFPNSDPGTAILSLNLYSNLKEKVSDLALCWSQPINSDAMTRRVWGHLPGPILPVVSPHRWFPDRTRANQCCGWTGLCGSYYLCKVYLSNEHLGTFSKHDLLLTILGWHTACPGPHREVLGRERECVNLGFAFVGFKGEVPRNFMGLLFYWQM